MSKTYFPLIVAPGDSIHLNLDLNSKSRKEFLRTIKISGQSLVNNKDVIDYLIHSPIDQRDFLKKKNELDASLFKKYRNEVYGNLQEYIDSLIIKNNYSKEFLNWIEAEKQYSLMNSYSFLEVYKSQQDTEEDKFNLNNLSDIDYKSLINTKVSNALPQNFYAYYALSNQERIAQLMENDPDNAFPFLLKKIIEDNKEFPNTIKLIFNELAQSFFTQRSLETYEYNKILFDSVLANSIYTPYLNERYVKVKSLIEKSEPSKEVKLLEFKSSDNSKLIEEIVSNAEGKVIYIDHWATWCAPCLKEFEKSTGELINKYNQNVEFVFLCYQSDKEQWKSYIKKYELSGKHYFIEKVQLPELTKLFSIKGFPTYTIINKKGEIELSGSSYRPSSPETEKILDKLIK